MQELAALLSVIALAVTYPVGTVGLRVILQWATDKDLTALPLVVAVTKRCASSGLSGGRDRIYNSLEGVSAISQ